MQTWFITTQRMETRIRPSLRMEDSLQEDMCYTGTLTDIPRTLTKGWYRGRDCWALGSLRHQVRNGLERVVAESVGFDT